jgi:hypothetical protein
MRDLAVEADALQPARNVCEVFAEQPSAASQVNQQSSRARTTYRRCNMTSSTILEALKNRRRQKCRAAQGTRALGLESLREQRVQGQLKRFC